jgi:hypothetical protein
MFDSRVGGQDAAATLSLVSAAHRQILEQECKLLELAAHWADLHHPDSQAPAERTLPGAELGGEGSPHRPEQPSRAEAADRPKPTPVT